MKLKDYITVTPNRFENREVVSICACVNAELPARIAMDLAKHLSMVAATPDGEDTAGRQKLRLLSPEEVGARACEIARELVNQFEERGWLTQLPEPKTLPDEK